MLLHSTATAHSPIERCRGTHRLDKLSPGHFGTLHQLLTVPCAASHDPDCWRTAQCMHIRMILVFTRTKQNVLNDNTCLLLTVGRLNDENTGSSIYIYILQRDLDTVDNRGKVDQFLWHTQEIGRVHAFRVYETHVLVERNSFRCIPQIHGAPIDEQKEPGRGQNEVLGRLETERTRGIAL